MERIPVVATEEEIKKIVSSGSNFNLAQSVTGIELWTENITKHDCVADALQASTSITSVKMHHLSRTVPSKTAAILDSLHSSKTLNELEVQSNNVQYFGLVGNLLMQNSSIRTLIITGFGCLSTPKETLFFSGLEANSSVTSIKLKALENYNTEKTNEDFKRLVSALRNNATILKFSIEVADTHKIVSPEARLNGHERLSITIERKPNIMENLDRLIDDSNWEELATFLRTNCPTVRVKSLYSDAHNLNTKTFVDKLAIHSVKKLFEDISNEKNEFQTQTEEKQKHCAALTKQRDELRKQLADVEALLAIAEDQLQSNSKLLLEKSSVQSRLQENMQIFEDALRKNESALKKWQQKLHTDISTWSCEDVSFLLSEIGLGNYARVFLSNKTNGAVLKAVETSYLTALGLSFMEAKKLQMYLHLVQTHHDIYTIPAGVLQWNNDTVCTWLQANNLSHLVGIFRTHQVSGAEFVFLEKADLTGHLKIQALGDVSKLQLEIAKLKDSLKGEQGPPQKDDGNNNANLYLQLQLEEMRRVNDELKVMLQEKNTKIPDAFICPITFEMMTDPVVASDGHTYERTAIELWLKNNDTSPMTGLQLPNKQLTPSHTVKSMISEFVDAAKKK